MDGTRETRTRTCAVAVSGRRNSGRARWRGTPWSTDTATQAAAAADGIALRLSQRRHHHIRGRRAGIRVGRATSTRPAWPAHLIWIDAALPERSALALSRMHLLWRGVRPDFRLAAFSAASSASNSSSSSTGATYGVAPALRALATKSSKKLSSPMARRFHLLLELYF